MIVPDVNVLLYAMDTQSPHHERAWQWWESALRGVEHIGFSWSVITGYLRLTTNPRVMPTPLTIELAMQHVRAWLTAPRSHVLSPGAEHLHVMERLIAPLGRAGTIVSDAHLAALALEHGGTIYSADEDFARFERVRWVNPLV